MNFRPLNPVGDSWNEQEEQKESISNKLNKRIFILILLLVVIAGGVFLYQKNPTGKEYVGRVKSLLSEKLVSLKAMIAPELDLSEDSGLDLSEVNFESLLTEGGEEEEEEEFASAKTSAGKEEEEEIVITPKQLTLPEIKERIDEIVEKTERIKQGVERLTALAEIQKEVNAVAQKTETLGQKLDTLKVLVLNQKKIDSFAEETELTNQETT